jgi:hypothetical protein
MNANKSSGLWIPNSLWLNDDLSVVEKCLLAVINSFESTNAGCFASNEYLGRCVGVTAGRCANILTDLRKRGYLNSTFVDANNRTLSVIRVHENVKDIHENVNPISQKSEAPIHENVKGGSRKREGGVHENVNIYIKNTNTVKNKEESKKEVNVYRANTGGEGEHLINSTPAPENAPIFLINERPVVEQLDTFEFKDPDMLKKIVLDWCNENIETVKSWYADTRSSYIHENAKLLIRKFISHYTDDKSFNRDPIRFFRSKYIKWIIREKDVFTKN